MSSSSASNAIADLETRLLSVLLSATTARDGVEGLLAALAPVLDDAAAALAIRDRDGMTLHVLAESGPPADWPGQLSPRNAIGAQPGVDPGTNAFIIPLRAEGVVVGALMLADAQRAASLLRDEQTMSLLDTTAAVIGAIVKRIDAEISRRGLALRSIDSVMQGMGHQMANPLTGASALAQLLLEELTDEAHRETVRQIHEEMKRAFTVLHDLLEQHRDTRAQDGVIDLSAFAERIVRFRGYEIREGGIALEIETAPKFLPVHTDARRLEHALLLALLSAEQRSQGSVNRSIDVRVGELGEQELAIEITDSSIGDLPAVAPRYFDLPLVAPDRPLGLRDEVPDLGLVDSILRAAGGRLEVRGSKASGTTLVLVLPRTASHPADQSVFTNAR